MYLFLFVPFNTELCHRRDLIMACLQSLRLRNTAPHFWLSGDLCFIGIPPPISPSRAELGWSEIRTSLPLLCYSRQAQLLPQSQAHLVATWTWPASLSLLPRCWGSRKEPLTPPVVVDPGDLVFMNPQRELTAHSFWGKQKRKAEAWMWEVFQRNRLDLTAAGVLIEVASCFAK